MFKNWNNFTHCTNSILLDGLAFKFILPGINWALSDNNMPIQDLYSRSVILIKTAGKYSQNRI